MALITRSATLADAPQLWALGREAFAEGSPSPPAAWPDPTAPHRRTVVGCDAQTGAVLAKACDMQIDSWIGGRRVPTSGVAGVAITAEARGHSALPAVLHELMTSSRERGAVISTLYPTAPGIYRRFGYEHLTSLTLLEVPTARLAAARLPYILDRDAHRAEDIILERVTTDTVHEVLDVYDQWAQRQHGPLAHDGPCFTPEDTAQEYLTGGTGATLARSRDGICVGYSWWTREQGYKQDGLLVAQELVALTPAAHVALLRNLGSHETVAPRTHLHSSEGDDLTHMLPSASITQLRATSYMMAVLDVVGVLEARGYPPGLQARLAFEVSGLAVPGQDGAYLLEVAEGRGTVQRMPSAPGDAAHLSAAGLALLCGGASSCSRLRTLGHLRAGSPADDAWWDALCGGRPVHIRDYF